MRDHLVIVGGGFVGSLAGIVAAPNFRRVTIIERSPPSEDGKHGGAPQSDHVHIFLKSGQTIMEALIPGFLARLEQNGASKADWARDTEWTGRYGIYRRFTSGVETLLFSRRLLNRILWEMLSALPNVQIIKTSVDRYVFAQHRVKELHLKNGQVLADADLYIEARGRYTSVKDDLENVLGPIAEKRINNKLRYTSTVIDTPISNEFGIKQYYRQANPINIPLGYYVSPIEGNRTIFTAVDYHSAISRPFEHLSEHPLLSGREIGSITSFAGLHNVHTQYGSVPKWIDNLTILGDAVARLNPVFGLGMTLAAQQVALLAESLKGDRALRTHALQKKIDRLIRPRWFAVELDEMRAVSHRRSLIHFMFDRYSDLLGKATYSSRAIHRLSLQVLHGVRSPFAFFLPWNVMRIVAPAIVENVSWSRARSEKKVAS